MKRFAKCFATAGVLAAAVSLAPVGAQAEQFVNVLTGGTSGVYYPLGVALSKIYGDKIADVRTQVQSTKASVENPTCCSRARARSPLSWVTP